ncbi:MULTISPECIES: hypothetical protein [Streptomyces]|uniref:Integral membrane protein n=1 Tax=Streptomyces solicathayae TaxID=3081768 RepID=A0ABZ0LYB2_9ACTN|nr:hypothetical protein [Streptomyces sp. HUAS YS2]WOX24424.1 hypothetical protein R2D22_24805 [Streptomyces sp. HUAS YS2]
MSRPVQGGVSVAALVVIPLLAVGGGDGFRAALDFTTGVLSLVSLTASVAWGLIATDRLLLTTRQRLLAQGIHRATAVASLGFLLLHGTVKVSLGHVEPLGAFIPFGLGVTGTEGLIGFGSLAGLLMIVAASTGALRSALAGRGRIAARWRPLHMLAYPAWCCALVHGLYAGRAPATWVVVMYCLSLAGVATAVALRMLPAPTRQRLADRLLALTGLREERPEEPREASREAEPEPYSSGAAQGPLRAFTERYGNASPEPYAASYTPPYATPYTSEVRREQGARPASLDTTTVRTRPRLTASAPAAAPSPAPTGGFSAAYRAVSDLPLAERVPMTEELPIVPDPAPRPGHWPAPSPPPPAYANPAEPVPGPLGRPAPGEPWTAPAGDRP